MVLHTPSKLKDSVSLTTSYLLPFMSSRGHELLYVAQLGNVSIARSVSYYTIIDPQYSKEYCTSSHLRAHLLENLQVTQVKF